MFKAVGQVKDGCANKLKSSNVNSNFNGAKFSNKGKIPNLRPITHYKFFAWVLGFSGFGNQHKHIINDTINSKP